LQSVPTIEEIARDQSRVRGLSTQAIAALMARAAAVQGTLSAALILIEPSAKPDQPEELDDEMLTVDEAANRLHRNRRWIYRHAKSLPFVKRLSPRNLLCSERKLNRWLEQRKA
jgi:hypothetical protein